MKPGQMLASSGPGLTWLLRIHGCGSPANMPDNSLVVPPRRVGEAFGFVFRSVVRGRGGQVVGSVLMVSDFGPIAEFLMDASGLDDTGEVLVGVDEGQRPSASSLPSRRPSPVTEVTTARLPGLERGNRGPVWLHADDRLSGQGRSGRLSAGGSCASRAGD